MRDSSFPAIVAAVDSLTRTRAGIGRTHIHKLLYLAETWGVLPQMHRFTLYLHGPYSRDLDGELLALRAAGFVHAEPDPAGFGAKYSANPKYVDAARQLLPSPADSTARLAILAETLAPLGVRALEAISTAEYVRQSNETITDMGQVKAVSELKPHLTTPEIKSAIATLAELRRRVKAALPTR